MWVRVTQPLLAQLGTPRNLAWIKNWVRSNRTKSGDYLNTLAWLSIRGLITPCYDSKNVAHWVTINNVPYGWLTYQVTSEAHVKYERSARKKNSVEPSTENLESSPILTEIGQEA